MAHILDLHFATKIQIPDSQGKILSDTFQISLYENQRYKYPFLGWKQENLIASEDPSRFSYCAGDVNTTFTDIMSLKLPNGWQCENKWSIDKEYSNTDTSGWCYGSSFSRIMGREAEHKGTGVQAFRVTRRRRWNLLCRPVLVEGNPKITTHMQVIVLFSCC